MNNKLSKGISWIFNSLFIAQHPARTFSIYSFSIRYTDNTISCDLKQKDLRTIILSEWGIIILFWLEAFEVFQYIIPLNKCGENTVRIGAYKGWYAWKKW